VPPTTSARSWSCSAPATISLAEAEPSSVRTVSGSVGNTALPDVVKRCGSVVRPRTLTISCPSFRNRLDIAML
jgi:hypothetical protein